MSIEREHGSLSTHQAGPFAQRHAEDVDYLLTKQRDAAAARLGGARQAQDAAIREIERWEQQLALYDEMLAALRRVATATAG